jgi:hypothetical protein
MSGRRNFLRNAAATVVISKTSLLRSFEFVTGSSETIGPTISDREKAGLRGPVRMCVEETGAPPSSSKLSFSTEYSTDGRLLTSRNANPDGSGWVRTLTYADDGRLGKTVSGKIGEPGVESLYAYDESGRLISITNDPEKGCRTDFHYDEEGPKTSTQTFGPDTIRAKHAAFGVPVGGNITTIYNSKNQSTETQTLDSQGRIVTRIVRTYDINGQLVEEKPVLENPALMFVATSGIEGQPQPSTAQLEGMNKAMRAMMGGRNGTGTSYSYDAQGRVTETRVRNFMFDKVTTTSYNEHGDKSAEVETMTDNSNFPFGTAVSVDESGTIIPDNRVATAQLPDSLFNETKVSFDYLYDSYGNWTEETTNRSFQFGVGPSIRYRTLTYY